MSPVMPVAQTWTTSEKGAAVSAARGCGVSAARETNRAWLAGTTSDLGFGRVERLAMQRGYVTKWLVHRNFGFLQPEGGGEDVFVHGSVLRDATALAAGDRVEYQLAGKGARLGSIHAPGLLEGMRAPNASELSILLKLLVAYAQGCEVQRRFLLADFEGEMLGYCGELSTAALLETKVLDQNLRPLSANALGHAPLGLLIDLRSTPCIDAFRPLMESPKIMKVMWGADADFESLLHQEFIQPQAVTDLQLAFSSGDRRLGMARMLERLPADLMSPLPDKKQRRPQWDGSVPSTVSM
eukprot:g22640.t1